jgi:hypothetical protein
MTLSGMFEDQDAETFEARRDEVVAIVSSALDLAGADRGLAALMQRLTSSASEDEFDKTFDEIVSGIRETTPQVVHAG